MKVDLFKRVTTYDDHGKQKTATAFFLLCGDALIQIEIKCRKTRDNPFDPDYSTNKRIVAAFADTLIE